MSHIIIVVIFIIVFSVVIFRLRKQVSKEWISLFIAIGLAICSYIYQSGENRKLQNLQYKRDSYANLMEELAIFKTSSMQTAANVEDFTEIYFRSWAETSDEINSLLLNYLRAYKEWTKDKNETTKKAENEAFNKLTEQIKKEINPGSKAKFVPYRFGLPSTKR